MIDIKRKEDCCGCNACGDACAHEAITFKTDNEGFWYPEVDKEKCVDCGLCEKVCPVIHSEELKKNEYTKAKCFASVHKNLEVRFDSTSGGLFSAFAERILKDGGVVGGAIYNDDFTVSQVLIEKKNELPPLRGSKYLQSDFTGFYKKVKQYLKDGRKVLICGSPCQMAAIRSYLNFKDTDNLFIVDYICRGIPSSKIFHKYLSYWEEKEGSKVTYFKFKIKDLGWRTRTMKIGFKNGHYRYDPCDESLYDLGYHHTHAFCRPSCYECKFIGFPRIADVTIADFWGAEKFVGKELDNDMGTSLVMCNNSKGLELFKIIGNHLVSKEVPFEDCIGGNPALVTPHPQPVIDRKEFYERLDKEDFESFVKEIIAKDIHLHDTWKQRLKSCIKPYYVAAKYFKEVFSNGPRALAQYVKYNKVSCLLGRQKGLFLPLKNVVLDIHSKANLHLEGVLRIGLKRIKGSNLETRLLIEEGGTLNVKGNFVMFYGADVEVFKGATLEFGDGSGFNLNCNIVCDNSIKIGKNVAIGRNVTIRDNNGGHYISRQGYKNSRPVEIGDHAWLCESCTIMPGVKIGTGAIVAAGSTVYNSVPPFTMVSGNPAKVIDENVLWKH